MSGAVNNINNVKPVIQNQSLEDVSESFCQKTFNLSFQETAKQWADEPERVIRKGLQIVGGNRKNMIEALRPIFAFKSTEPLPSRAFVNLVFSKFPCGQLFEPSNKMNFAKFKESQILFRNFAILYYDFIQNNKTGSATQFIAFLEEQQTFSNSDLNVSFREILYTVLKDLFPTIQTIPAQNCDFAAPFYHRIYTITNALIALQDPVKILDQIKQLNHVNFTKQHEEKLINDIKAYGKFFIEESIRLHFHQLLENIPSKIDFIREIDTICNQLMPFVRRAALALLTQKIDFKDDTARTLLSTYSQNGSNDTAPIACTLLQAFLGYFGVKTEIYYRMDIDPALSITFAHSILVITNPENEEKILVDCTYQQFLKHLVPSSQLEKLPEILFCRASELEATIDHFSRFRSESASSVFAQNLSKCPIEKFRAHFRKIWGLSGYILVTKNYNTEAIFGDSLDTHKGHSCVKELFRGIGLESAIPYKSFGEKLSELKSKKNIDELTLVEMLAEINDDKAKSFAAPLKLDERPIRAKLLPLKTVGYLMSICQQVNPSKESSTITIYGASGADLSPLLALNTGRLFMIEKTPVDFMKLTTALKQGRISENYRKARSTQGAGLSGDIDPKKDYYITMEGIEDYIATELFCLGVNLKDVVVTKAPEFNGVTLSFKWNYQDCSTRAYEVTWVSMHLEEPGSYPKGFKELLGAKNVNYYYQKAANHLPSNYSKFLPLIRESLKENGCILTSDYDSRGRKHDPEPYLENFTQLEDSKLTKAYKNLFAGMLMQDWFLEFAGKLEDRFIPPREEYFTFVDIRKRTDTSQEVKKV